jgi:acyl carrier protein
MDETGNHVAVGETGEVVIRGASLMSGYEPEERNAGAFTNGWFRTGDLGHLDAGGYLFLTGRLKEMINRGGEKISPSEVDAALLDHPEVLQAATFAVPHPTLGEDIAAAIVLRNPDDISEASVREYLSERLAPFKVPSRLLVIDEIPKSSTGKIQRAALAERFAQALQSGFVDPRDELERILIDIYADVLETRHLGAGDNFFALGGDSLRATQVISRVRSLFSIDLPIATLFAKPTAAELAAEIAALMEALDQASTDTIVS